MLVRLDDDHGFTVFQHDTIIAVIADKIICGIGDFTLAVGHIRTPTACEHACAVLQCNADGRFGKRGANVDLFVACKINAVGQDCIAVDVKGACQNSYAVALGSCIAADRAAVQVKDCTVIIRKDYAAAIIGSTVPGNETAVHVKFRIGTDKHAAGKIV